MVHPTSTRLDLTQLPFPRQQLYLSARQRGLPFALWNPDMILAWLEVYVGAPAWLVTTCRYLHFKHSSALKFFKFTFICGVKRIKTIVIIKVDNVLPMFLPMFYICLSQFENKIGRCNECIIRQRDSERNGNHFLPSPVSNNKGIFFLIDTRVKW